MYALTTVRGKLLAGFDDGHVVVSTDKGISWTDMSARKDKAVDTIVEFVEGQEYLYLGCEFGGVWRFPLAKLNALTSAEADRPEIPTQSTLVGNYPNPFNPMTTIVFTVAGDGRLAPGAVTLDIYDMLGQQAARLVDEQKPAGTYRAPFDGSQVSAGIYVYRLTVGATTISRKMLLVK